MGAQVPTRAPRDCTLAQGELFSLALKLLLWPDLLHALPWVLFGHHSLTVTLSSRGRTMSWSPQPYAAPAPGVSVRGAPAPQGEATGSQ